MCRCAQSPAGRLRPHAVGGGAADDLAVAASVKPAMQQANQAYDRKDLLTLQLGLEQTTSHHLASLPNDRLLHYNQVLQAQLATLVQEMADGASPYLSQLGAAAGGRKQVPATSAGRAEASRGVSASVAAVRPRASGGASGCSHHATGQAVEHLPPNRLRAASCWLSTRHHQHAQARAALGGCSISRCAASSPRVSDPVAPSQREAGLSFGLLVRERKEQQGAGAARVVRRRRHLSRLCCSQPTVDRLDFRGAAPERFWLSASPRSATVRKCLPSKVFLRKRGATMHLAAATAHCSAPCRGFP